MRTVLVFNLMFLSLVANAAEIKHNAHDDVIWLDKQIEGRILAARNSLRILDEKYKLYIGVDAELISNYTDKVVKHVNDARYYVNALQKGKASNAADRKELNKHVKELNAIEAKAHSYARCSHLAEASKAKSDQELLSELNQHLLSDKNFKREQRFAERCAKLVENTSHLFLKALNSKANTEVLKKDKKLKARIEAQAVEIQKSEVKSAVKAAN